MKLYPYLLTLLTLLGGCMVGPNYTPPPTYVPTEFMEDRPGRTSLVGDEDLFHWWQDTFCDPFLDQILEETLTYNFDLRSALQRVYQARANYWVQFTAILPEIDFDFQATRYHTSESFVGSNVEGASLGTSAALNSPFQNFFQTGLDAVWEIDLFGKLRRSAKSAYYAWEATLEDERGIRITVLSEAANLYLTICYYQTKVGLSKQLIAFDEDLAELSKELFLSGLAGEEQMAQAFSTLEADKAALNLLEIALKQSIYSLAVLLGNPPEALVNAFEVDRPIPMVSGKIPESLPSELLRRRPDIASAERSLAAQTELIGVAVAELFPTVSLIGSTSSYAANPLQGANFGFSSNRFSRLFNGSSNIWGVGSLITLPIFDFGSRCANVNIQKFLTNEAYITYEKTVITALQEVEASLAAYFNDDERVTHFTRQIGCDLRNLELVSDQYQAGLADYTQVLEAKEKWLASANSLTDSQQSLGIDLIAIYKALGGDW